MKDRIQPIVRNAVMIGLAMIVLEGFCLYASAVPGIESLAEIRAQVRPAQIYSPTADAKVDIRAALRTAKREHKRVILDFGANWCGDCHVLNFYFHDPANAGLLAANYVLVDVNVGMYDKNLDLARKYGIPLNKGVPALVVLSPAGHIVYAQQHGEFEKMRRMDSSAVTAFLEKWKPVKSEAGMPANHARKPS